MSHDDRAQLIDIIRGVRRRWRTNIVLRGAAIAFAGALAALLLSASSLQALRFTPASIVALRVVLIVVCSVLAIYWVVRPFVRTVSDVQVALYLEERDRTLQAAIISAVEALDREDPLHSRALVDRLVAHAVEKSRAFYEVDQNSRGAIARSLAGAGAAAAIAILLIVFGPSYLRHGVSALLVISRPAEAASPYRIDVRPGNATVPRQSDQAVSARLSGFHSNTVTLKVRPADGSGNYQDVPLMRSAEDAFEGMLFRVDKPVQYFVESNGVRSSIYSLSLVDLPAVKQLDLEYRFPSYTGLPPQKVESGGDVAALRGTDVILRVTPTMNTPGGQIVLNDNDRSPLTREADGSLTGSFKIAKQGFYRIELVGPKGEPIAASPQYTIDAVGDQAPSVSFVRPGRDTSATPVEELHVEARAEDDFGVRQLDLIYSANGGPEKTVRLATPARPTPELSAGHTLYLEELGLKPGDSVSYYARATDNDAVQGPKAATSDIYFVQIRPFRKDYKPAESQAQMGGGGAGNQVGALSQQQRQIVAATFNTVRDRAKMSADKFRENVVFLTLAQSKLRQQVDELVQKMSSREVDRDPAFADIATTLPKASAEMRSAEGDLQKQSAKDALSPEQRALEYLQQAEQKYEVQVSANRGGGGGGSQSDEMADDLADLFQLELDKLANQYEMQQRAGQQGADKQIDELAERLKELARRQQQEAERQQRMAQSGGGGAAGGGASQRALADEAEQAARRLEQMSREEPRADLREAAKQLQQAADAMRRAAANGARDGGAQAAAAQEQVRQALERVQRMQSGRADRDVADALGKANALAADEQQVAAGVKSLPQSGPARSSQAQTLADRKTAMESKVDALQQQLERLSDAIRGDEREASRKLQEAASAIKDNKLKDKIRYSKGMLQSGSSEYARGFEESIGEGVDALKKKVAEAAGAMGKGSRQSAVNRALERTRELQRGLASMGQRDTNGSPQNDAKSGENAKAGERDANGNAQSQSGQGAAASPDGRGQQSSSSGQAQQGQAGTAGQQADGRGQPGGGYGGRFGSPNGWIGDPGRFRRELRDWQTAAEEARRRALEAGANVRDLTDAIRDVQRLDDGRVFDDPRAFEQLRAAALDRLKRFELDLVKRAEGNEQPLALSGNDDVPPAYRAAVEEYYRSLSRKQPK